MEIENRLEQETDIWLLYGALVLESMWVYLVRGLTLWVCANTVTFIFISTYRNKCKGRNYDGQPFEFLYIFYLLA